MPLKKKFIVVDDHPLYRSGVSALIKQELDLECVGEAASPGEAMEIIGKSHPDLAIIDISLQQQNGLELVSALKASYPRILMLVVSMHEENLYGERAVKAGARGYIMKHQRPESLVEAVRTILAGNIAISDNLKNRLFESLVGHQRSVDPVQDLSNREFEVFSMISRGNGASEIADHMNLSVKTINTYQENIKEKLGIPSASELRKFAVDWATRQT
ncbi:MAG: response regulator [Sphaerochaetaceae bacterium]